MYKICPLELLSYRGLKSAAYRAFRCGPRSPSEICEDLRHVWEHILVWASLSLMNVNNSLLWPRITGAHLRSVIRIASAPDLARTFMPWSQWSVARHQSIVCKGCRVSISANEGLLECFLFLFFFVLGFAPCFWALLFLRLYLQNPLPPVAAREELRGRYAAWCRMPVQDQCSVYRTAIWGFREELDF